MNNAKHWGGRLMSWLLALQLISVPLFSGLTVLAAIGLSQDAQANLTLAPTRVVFTDRIRSRTVTVANPTNQTRTYRIEWLEQRMTEDGRYEPIDEQTLAQKPPLSSMIRHSPRRVTVKGGGHQKVRLHLRLPGELEPGEYRSHLLFKAEPLPLDADDYTAGRASVKLAVNLSFSIPVIYRHGGPGDVEINMDELAFQKSEKGDYNMVVLLSHKGNISSFGHFEILLNKGGSGPEEQIGQLQNVAVYNDSPRRRVTIPLQITSLSAGDVIRIVYLGDGEYKGRTLAERSFRVGQ